MKLSQLFEEHQVNVALQKLQAASHGGMVDVGAVLGKDVETALNYADMSQPPAESLRVETLTLTNLIPIQEDVEVDHVAAYINGNGRSGKDLILVVRDEAGQLLIQDGHHRVVAAVLMGAQTIQAQVATVDYIDNDNDFNAVVVYK